MGSFAICPPSNFPDLEAATLGIDFGSTSTRAYLWCPERNDGYNVESTGRAGSSQRFSPGDFSSIGYPFDGGEVYLGENSDPSRESISLKYAFYILADAPDEMVSQYRLSEPLRSRQHETQFRDRLEKGIRKLFAAVYHRVVAVCREEELRVTTIGLSVPSQWTLEFMDLYRGIIGDVFKQDSETIFFVTEVEALAHFLCAKKMRRLIPLQNSFYNAVVVMLDFGGHTMNTCTLNIVREPDGAPAFYLIGEPVGAAGGSELWECLLIEISLAYVQQEYGFSPSARNKQRLFDSINRAKREAGPECDRKDFDCVVIDRGREYSVNLGESYVADCFNQAMSMPLTLAAARIKEAARSWQSRSQNSNSDMILGSDFVEKPRVILAGGTASHKGLERIIAAICHSNGLDGPVKTRDIMTQYDSAKIAHGAAYAVASPMTVEQFMEQGAAFGLQMRQALKPGETESEHRWDNIARFLFSQRRRRPDKEIEIVVRSGDELKIVCDPFFERKNGSKGTELYYDRCYDFVDLGRPTQGTWWFRLSLEGHGDQMQLVIERSRRCGSAKGPNPCRAVTLPLHYNRGSNSVHPGDEFCDPNQDKNILSLRYYPESCQQRTTSQGAAPPRTHRLVARKGKDREAYQRLAYTDRAARPKVLGKQPLRGRRARRGARR